MNTNIKNLRQCKSYVTLPLESPIKTLSRKGSIGDKLSSFKATLGNLTIDKVKVIPNTSSPLSKKGYLILDDPEISQPLVSNFFTDSSKNVVLNVASRNNSPNLRNKDSRASLSNKSSISSLNSSCSIESCSTLSSLKSKVARPLPAHPLYKTFQKGFDIRALDSESSFDRILLRGYEDKSCYPIAIPTLYLTLTPSGLRA